MIIGYTTGTYDIFHVGHLNILKKAKEQCDYLIVGVSSDELVMEYKGKLPIMSYEERRTIVEAIKYVDEVVMQVSLDKMDAWEKYKFDILFHGDDWKGTSLYNEVEAQLKNKGVKVVYFPYTPNISSTKLKEEVFDRRRNDK